MAAWWQHSNSPARRSADLSAACRLFGSLPRHIPFTLRHFTIETAEYVFDFQRIEKLILPSTPGNAGCIYNHSMTTEDMSQKIARECIAMRVRRLNRVVTKIYDDSLRPLGLRTAQQTILVAISLMKIPTPTDIERRLSLEKSTVSRNVDRMHRRGWVAFVPGEDGRSHHLKLTAKGVKLLRESTAVWQVAQKKVASLLGKEGVTALSRILSTFRAE